jgi:hypothetical protein
MDGWCRGSAYVGHVDDEEPLDVDHPPDAPRDLDLGTGGVHAGRVEAIPREHEHVRLVRRLLPVVILCSTDAVRCTAATHRETTMSD